MSQSGNLAVFSPTLGSRSETFIKRHVTDLLPQKTIVVCKRQLTDTLNDWGVEAPILDLSNLPRFNRKTRVVRRTKQRFGLNLTDYKREHVKNFLISNNVKALLSEYLDQSIPWIGLARELGIRMYAHAHGYDVSVRLQDPDWIKAYRELNQVSGVITMNSISKERLIEIGIRESLISVIPYGIHIPPDKKKYTSNHNIRCLAVGRMTGKKAPIFLLEAFRRALMIYPDMVLDYVGDGDLMPSVDQFVNAFNLEEKVILHGSQENAFVHELMKESDMFLQHSITCRISGDQEGLPVAILEAMAHGLPVIATIHSGIPEAVIDQGTGFLVEEGKIDLMSDRIVLLARDSSLREKLGKCGRNLAEKRFSWSSEKNKLLQVMHL